MADIGELVVYKYKGLYRVIQIGTLKFQSVDKHKRYYTLEPEDGSAETVYTPAEDSNPNIRKPVAQEEAQKLIHEMQQIETLWIANEKMREQEYKKCIFTYRCEDWIRVMKTIYAHIKARGIVTVMDRKYQQIAERALHNELAYALRIPCEDIRSYIEVRVNEASGEKITSYSLK